VSLKETYNKIAKDWHNDHNADDWWHEGTDVFAALLSKGAHVLDVGCGAGHKTKYLFDKGFKVTGVDFSENLLAIAQEEAPDAEYVVSDMRDLSQIEGQADAIFSQASLLHIPKSEAPDVIAHWNKKVRPGGYIYIAVKGVKEGYPEEQTITENDYGYEYERFFSFYTIEEIKGYLENLGLQIEYESEKMEGGTNWIQVIAKK